MQKKKKNRQNACNQMTCAYLYAYIRVITKTDPKQSIKKSILTLEIYEDIWKVILLKDICFSSAISFFSKCFQLKYSRNLFKVERNTI